MSGEITDRRGKPVALARVPAASGAQHPFPQTVSQLDATPLPNSGALQPVDDTGQPGAVAALPKSQSGEGQPIALAACPGEADTRACSARIQRTYPTDWHPGRITPHARKVAGMAQGASSYSA